MASTTNPPDPIPCALATVLLPELRAHGCHMQKTLFPERNQQTPGDHATNLGATMLVLLHVAPLASSLRKLGALRG